MSFGFDYKRFAVLYVDDERNALKYFERDFGEEFTVITALSAEKAQGILKSKGQEIGILITDQRMPEMTGVDLLAEVRTEWPSLIRILTTAYSDLDSAIDAVNTGAIYKYVVKPWDVRELRILVLRAMELFLIQRDRDLLFREKLSALQRILTMDRVRSIAVMAAGLAHHIRNSMVALMAFLDLTPVKLKQELDQASVKSPHFWEDLWSLAQEESKKILRIVHRLAETTVDPEHRFDDRVTLHDTLNNAIERIKEFSDSRETILHLDIPNDLPQLTANESMLQRCFEVLLKRLLRLPSGNCKISLRAEVTDSVCGTSGIKLAFASDGPEWSTEEVAAMFAIFSPMQDDPEDLGLNLLSAFFIVYHHGGEIAVHRKPPSGPAFEVRLPFDPGAVERSETEDECIARITTHFDYLGTV